MHVVSVHGLKPEGDEDERAIQGYARQHPQEDLDEDEEEQAQTSSSQQGGVVVEVSSAIQGQQAMEAEGEAQAARDKRAPGEVRLPIPGRQRVAEAEATKRGQQPEGIQKVKAAKLSSPGLIPTQRFREPSPKQQRTALYSPMYAGEVSKNLADSSSSRHVRRVVEKPELKNKDEVGFWISLRSLGTGSSLKSPSKLKRARWS